MNQALILLAIAACLLAVAALMLAQAIFAYAKHRIGLERKLNFMDLPPRDHQVKSLRKRPDDVHVGSN